MSASPAFKIEPGSPQAWREAFLRMKPSVVPCAGLTAQGWQVVHAAPAWDAVRSDLAMFERVGMHRGSFQQP